MKNAVHISEAEAAGNFERVLARVRAGAEVVIEHNAQPVAVIRAARPPGRTLAECLALAPVDSPGVVDADFAKDVQAAISAHQEPLTWG